MRDSILFGLPVSGPRDGNRGMGPTGLTGGALVNVGLQSTSFTRQRILDPADDVKHSGGPTPSNHAEELFGIGPFSRLLGIRHHKHDKYDNSGYKHKIKRDYMAGTYVKYNTKKTGHSTKNGKTNTPTKTIHYNRKGKVGKTKKNSNSSREGKFRKTKKTSHFRRRGKTSKSKKTSPSRRKAKASKTKKKGNFRRQGKPSKINTDHYRRKGKASKTKKTRPATTSKKEYPTKPRKLVFITEREK
jgi:hypothetical protein